MTAAFTAKSFQGLLQRLVESSRAEAAIARRKFSNLLNSHWPPMGPEAARPDAGLRALGFVCGPTVEPERLPETPAERWMAVLVLEFIASLLGDTVAKHAPRAVPADGESSQTMARLLVRPFEHPFAGRVRAVMEGLLKRRPEERLADLVDACPSDFLRGCIALRVLEGHVRGTKPCEPPVRRVAATAAHEFLLAASRWWRPERVPEATTRACSEICADLLKRVPILREKDHREESLADVILNAVLFFEPFASAEPFWIDFVALEGSAPERPPASDMYPGAWYVAVLRQAKIVRPRLTSELRRLASSGQLKPGEYSQRKATAPMHYSLAAVCRCPQMHGFAKHFEAAAKEGFAPRLRRRPRRAASPKNTRRPGRAWSRGAARS